MEEIDQKSLTICSGIDYTNIHYQHVICADAKTAKVVKQKKISYSSSRFNREFRSYFLNWTFIWSRIGKLGYG